MELQAERNGLTYLLTRGEKKEKNKKKHAEDKTVLGKLTLCVFLCVRVSRRGTWSSARPPSVLEILCTCDVAIMLV